MSAMVGADGFNDTSYRRFHSRYIQQYGGARTAVSMARCTGSCCALRGGLSEMSVEIEIMSGDASWPVAAPLYNVVWPPEVVATLPWANVVFAHADLRVLVEDETQGLVCHVGIYRREAMGKGARGRSR